MSKLNHKLLKLSLLLCLMPAHASQPAYAPDIMEVQQDESLWFDTALSVDWEAGATLEFWLATSWDSEREYEPVVLSMWNNDQPAMVVRIQADRKAVVIQSSQQIGTIPADLANPQLNHIALIFFDEDVMLFMNGQVLGSVRLAQTPTSVNLIHIANVPDGGHAFSGAIGGLRLWDMPLAAETLVEYALSDPLSRTAPHPDLESLVMYSQFNASTLELTEAQVSDGESGVP